MKKNTKISNERLKAKAEEIAKGFIACLKNLARNTWNRDYGAVVNILYELRKDEVPFDFNCIQKSEVF